MTVTVPAWTWAKAIPVAVSDTVDNIGGVNAAGQRNLLAKYLHNRSAAAVLLHIVVEGDAVITLGVGADDHILGGSQWKRVKVTGTTGGGSSGAAYETILTSTVGAEFANQPANDGVEIVSDSAADTTQSITVYGTTQATDTVVVETVDLDGTTPVSTIKTDWGVILGVVLSASCAGTITVREASGNAAITTLLTTVLSKGVQTVTNTSAYNTPPTVVASGATTKQIGLYGTDAAGTAAGDSQALSGTTAVVMNSGFGTVTLVLTGDLESSVTVTASVSTDIVALY